MSSEGQVGIWRVVRATVNHKPRTFIRPIKVFSRPGSVVEYRGNLNGECKIEN